MSTENYGRYQLLKRIATGGMAQIYLARQTGLEGFEKLLVVKRILAHLAENQDFVRMFLDEARIAARLNHPNIVQIFDLGAQDGTFFIAMEYIHGEDVRRVWKRAANRGRVMPVPLVCRVMMEACAGLDYAHKKADTSGKPLGIVHRDISPQNILVTFEGGVKVVDFGIAKAADQATVTRSGVLKGKYSYMSPEQANGERVDRRSDIFALGIVLHELLTGNRLFKRANDIQTLNAVSECKIPAPSLLSAAVPEDLDRIVLKALSKNPADRFQDAAELQGALEAWLIEHQLPSSSAHLAGFMQELYADRLAQEKAAGQVLVEEAGEGARPLLDDELGRSSSPPPMPQDDGAISLTGSEKMTELGIPSMSDLENTHLDRKVGPGKIDRTRSDPRIPERRPSSEPKRIPDPRSLELRQSGGGRPSPDLRSSGASRLTPSELRQSSGQLRQSSSNVRAGPDPRAELRQSGVARAEPRFETNRFELPEPGEDSQAATITTEAGTAPWRPPELSVSVTYGKRRPQSRLLPVVISAVSLAILAAVAGLIWARAAIPGPPATAAVHLETDPPGATVTLDGRLIVGEKTPLVLPAVAPGPHQLELTLAGYVELTAPLEIPEAIPPEGRIALPVLRLAPDPTVASAPAPRPVTLTVRSQPLGAIVVVGERQVGRTPHALQALPGEEIAFRVELAGFAPESRTIRLETEDLEEQIVLHRQATAGDARRDRGARGTQ